ncbi:MAG: hypothetical protein MJ240_11010 [Kiritimatiellae bacterium]|nr:hypothetical protein [Kiritimatiellia bacterium]
MRMRFLATAALLTLSASAGENLLRNAELVSKDGILPDNWNGSRAEAHVGAYVTTGGVLRISARAPAYCHVVSQTIPVDGNKSYWFEGDILCDALVSLANVRYSLLDAQGRPVVDNAPLLHPHFAGPVRKWAHVALPIPARDPSRVKKLRLSVFVYNNSRQPAEDLALYLRNPRIEEFCGQVHQPLPPLGPRGSDVLPNRPFTGLPAVGKAYRLERGRVGYLNLRTAQIPRRVPVRLGVALPAGVAGELYLRRPGDKVSVLDRVHETSPGVYELPKTTLWPLPGNTLLFAADKSVPDAFTIRFTIEAKGQTRVQEVLVEVFDGPEMAPRPKALRYRSWYELPLAAFTPSAATNRLARALDQYWLDTGLEYSRHLTANITGIFPYRHDAANPLARQGQGPHGTPTGIPCDSDLQAKGAVWYRDRLLGSKLLADKLPTAEYAVWDYEPYVVGPVTAGCFCEDCRRVFAREQGLAATPDANEILSQHREAWIHFRCRQRADSVKMAVAGLRLAAPRVKFALCTMPMAPGKGDAGYATDLDYLERYGIDMPLFEPCTDVFRSMNYTGFLTYYRSLEREMLELAKPKETLLENGWGDPRYGKLVGVQLAAAFFAGQRRPYLAEGIDISDGDQLAEIRRAMQFVATIESMLAATTLQRDKCACTVTSGPANRFWSFDRADACGRRWVLTLNCAPDKPLTATVAPPAGSAAPARQVTLPPCSWQVVAF